MVIPEQLNEILKADSNFKDAFKLLTPSCQKEYCNYIAEAKRETTKVSRLEKIKPMTLKGAGLHDKYKNC
ncbi:YdeI/OmpD-associated family protein [Lacinutrix sp.]|uniref:YdeI/OmpD-associated family protein n=1 Tax=Lacinutrix sp. TaxID=1937692 RepID=UPI0030ED07A9